MKRTRWGAALVVLALVAGACGGDDDDDDTGGTETEEGAEEEDNGGATDVGVTADSIKVGLIVTQTGNAASGSLGAEEGFEAYIEKVNEEGGVHGRQIEIVGPKDDAGDANRNSSVFQETVEQDKVFAMAGCFPVFGASRYAAQNQIPTFGCPFDKPWEEADNFFGYAGSWKDETPDEDVKPPPSAANAYIAKKAGADTMGVFAYNHEGSRQAALDACAAVETFGIDCVYEETSLPFGFTDLGASIEKIKASGAKYFYAAMDISGSQTILRSFKRAGLDDHYLLSAVGYGQETIDKFADVIENLFVTIQGAPIEADSDEPAMKEFYDEVSARKPGAKLGTTHLQGWQFAMLLVDGLEKAGPKLTRAKLNETVRGFTDWDADGLISKTDFTRAPEENYRDPNWKPDPDVCSSKVMRPDVKAKKWVQVLEKPYLCLSAVRTKEALDAKLKEDKSTIDIQ